MARLKYIGVCLFLTLVMIAWTACAEAADHYYLILGTPSAATRHAQGHYQSGHYPSGRHQARGYTLTARAYAWGWFGARPYTHGVRHRGYYNNAWAWGQ